MRSFKTSFTIVAFTASLLAVPFAGAYAGESSDPSGALDAATPADFQGPRADSIMNQLRGIDQGIADATQARTITPAEAHRLEVRDANITRVAQRTAATDHGRLPSGQYHQLMRRVDHLDQRLLSDTGSAMLMGDGSDGGHYPNG
ncbi:hypothetical protein [Mesorhizobium sp. A623]